MSYESPIKLFQTDPFIEHLRDETDNMIYRAVVHADVNVDRDELIKALEYDRGQYEKGYADGLAYKPPVVTHADRIRAMTDEELAEWIESIEPAACPWRDDHGDNCCFTHCRDCRLDWLKSPVEGGVK